MTKINLKTRLKEYFFRHPSSRLRVRQIERMVHIPLPSAIKYARELDREGILKVTTIAGVRLYSADISSKKFLLEKKLFNIFELYSVGLVDYLIKNHSNPVIIVYGSYAHGEDIETSDIDLYIETTEKVSNLTSFERKLCRKIHVQTSASLKSLDNIHLANSIMNGIILNGFVEIL
jgi:predicted nucleotidyltransferase